MARLLVPVSIGNDQWEDYEVRHVGSEVYLIRDGYTVIHISAEDIEAIYNYIRY